MRTGAELKYLAAFEAFRASTAAVLNVPPEELEADLDALMIDIDPSIDDLDVVEVVMAAEEDFGVEVSYDQMDTIDHLHTSELTLGNLFTLIVEAQPTNNFTKT